MKLPGKVISMLYDEAKREGENLVKIEYGDYDYTVFYNYVVTGEYSFAPDYIISEPEISIDIIEATAKDEEGNIIKLEI